MVEVSHAVVPVATVRVEHATRLVRKLCLTVARVQEIAAGLVAVTVAK